jgi:hypothetical protein
MLEVIVFDNKLVNRRDNKLVNRRSQPVEDHAAVRHKVVTIFGGPPSQRRTDAKTLRAGGKGRLKPPVFDSPSRRRTRSSASAPARNAG